MITDENHREIVQKLREACDEIERTGNGLTVWELTDILGIRDDDSSAMEGLNIDDARRLADLIDRPTTTRHGKFKTKYGRETPCCEVCGYSIGDMRWNYCPKCGAAITDD